MEPQLCCRPQGIPWNFTGNRTQEIVHYSLVVLAFLVAVITFFVQWAKPAPYGKHDKQDVNWGPLIPQRIGHIISDALPGVLLFILVFFLHGTQRDAVNIVFFCLFQAHYIHRGIIHPLVMRYSNPHVPLGITLGGLFPNLLFHYLNSEWIGLASYAKNYYYDPRFVIGVLLFVMGYVINKWSDFKLRSIRSQSGFNGYSVPYGGLFELVACPNYLGEFIEWLGWTLATWSLAGFIWFMFGAATFIPRARHNHQWYKSNFEDYPSNRKAIIPFLF